MDLLLHGHFIDSMIFHPGVMYTAVWLTCYLVSHTLNLITKGKCRAMAFRAVYFYILIGVIVVQWIFKNALILTKGIYIIG